MTILFYNFVSTNLSRLGKLCQSLSSYWSVCMKSKNRRVVLCLGGAFFASSILTGCGVSEKLIFGEENRQTSEIISAFFISADEKSFVVIGMNNHYIFDISPDLAKVLKSPLRRSISPDPFVFFANSDQVVNGDYVLRVSAKASQAVIESAKSLGFSPAPSGDLILRGHLVGKRYDSTGFPIPTGLQQFNHSYSARVIEGPSSGEQLGRKLASPVTTATDGALFLLAVPLFAVLFVCGDNGCH